MATVSMSTHALYEGLSHSAQWTEALFTDTPWRFGFLFGDSVFYFLSLPFHSPFLFPSHIYLCFSLRALDALELELQMVAATLWVLANKSLSFARETIIMRH